MSNYKDGWKSLAAEIISTAARDYRELKDRGLLIDGKLNLRKLIRAEIARVAYKYRGKPIGFTKDRLSSMGLSCRVRAVELSEIVKAARGRKTPPKTALSEMDLDEAGTAVSFFQCQGFVDLCLFVGVEPSAIRRGVGVHKETGTPQETPGRY